MLVYGLPGRRLRPFRVRRWSRARTFKAPASGARLTSEPQSLRTDHPFLRNVRSTTRSRLWLRSNFAIQKSEFVAGATRFSYQARPCQKSPSTKTASRAFRKEKSGVPRTSWSFRRKRRPRALSTSARRSSGSVLAVRTARMIRCRVSGSNMSAMGVPFVRLRSSYHSLTSEPLSRPSVGSMTDRVRTLS